MQGPFWIPPDSNGPFPPVELALDEPNGLLAVGADLSPSRLILAYRNGIFPWYSPGQPILWWSPDPRSVLFPQDLHLSKSLRKELRKGELQIRFDSAFRQVVEQCALPRADQQGTWITSEMLAAYCRLHDVGVAHSVEAWHGNELVGGLYGVALGRLFFGESMFTRRANASKIAFAHLVKQLQRWGFPLIDCQVHNKHLARLGASLIPRSEFLRYLKRHGSTKPIASPWQFDVDLADELRGKEINYRKTSDSN